MRAHLVGSIVLAVLPALAWAASCPDQTVECVPGGGRKTTACLSEWLVENPNAASFARRPSKTTETCLEGDPHWAASAGFGASGYGFVIS